MDTPRLNWTQNITSYLIPKYIYGAFSQKDNYSKQWKGVHDFMVVLGTFDVIQQYIHHLTTFCDIFNVLWIGQVGYIVFLNHLLLIFPIEGFGHTLSLIGK